MSPMPSAILSKLQSVKDETPHSEALPGSTDSGTHLFSLPPEIRLNIYELILSIYVHRTRLVGRTRIVHPERSNGMALLRVCRKISREAAPMLYRSNSIKAKDSEKVMCWFYAIGPANVSSLQSLRLHIGGFKSMDQELEQQNLYRMLSCLARQGTKLRSLQIHLSGGQRCWGPLSKDPRFKDALAQMEGLDTFRLGPCFEAEGLETLEHRRGFTLSIEPGGWA